MRTTISVAVVSAVLFATGAVAATGSQIFACQKLIYNSARYVGKNTLGYVLKCTDRVVRCKLSQEVDGVDPTACLASASLRCDAVVPALAAKQDKARVKAQTVCLPVSDTEMLAGAGGLGFAIVAASECGGATTTNDLVACAVDGARCRAEREFFRIDPRALDSLTAAGVETSFPCVGP